MRKLPPLNAVRTFEAAARHGSFTKAAEELHVTHGAVSRQVALLEDWFGVKLFRRKPQNLMLTDVGLAFAREASAMLDRLALASIEAKGRASPTGLRLNATPTFTMRWLISRLAAFQRQRADVELQLTTSIGPVTSSETGFDIAIRGEQGEVAGWTSVNFMTELIAPVCHVELVRSGDLAGLENLKDQTLLTYATEPYGWRQWFAAVGAEMPPGQDTQRYEQMYFALTACLEGMGVGLFPLFLVIDDLIAGRLCTPLRGLGLRRRAYHAFFRSDIAPPPVIGDFCAWLLETGHDTEQATLAWAQSQGWRL